MADNWLNLSDDFLARVHAGLMHLRAMDAIPVLNEIEGQLKDAADKAERYVAALELHVASLKAEAA